MLKRNKKLNPECFYGMPRKTASLVLALCTIPFGIFAAILYECYVEWELRDMMGEVTGTYSLACVVGMAVWLAAIILGGKCDAKRWKGLIICFVLSVGVGIGGVLFIASYDVFDFDGLRMMGFNFTAIVWVLSTLSLVRPTRKKRLQVLAAGSRETVLKGVVLCGKCQADMTALHDLVCPDCGSEFSLDELISCNAERVGEASAEQTDTLEVSDEA